MGARKMTEPTQTDDSGITEAIARAGSQKKLAFLIGATQQMVSYWKRAGIVSDAGMCASIERVTGVPCERLNPGEDWVTLRAVLCVPNRAGIEATDDVQPPVGGTNKSTKSARMAI